MVGSQLWHRKKALGLMARKYYSCTFNDKPPSPPKRKMKGEEVGKTRQTPWKSFTSVEKWEFTRSMCGSQKIYA